MKSNRAGGGGDSIHESNIGVSFVASNRSVFISWHNISFTVPIITQKNNTVAGGGQQLFMDPDDPRVTLLYAHHANRTSNDGSSLKSGQDINKSLGISKSGLGNSGDNSMGSGGNSFAAPMFGSDIKSSTSRFTGGVNSKYRSAIEANEIST